MTKLTAIAVALLLVGRTVLAQTPKPVETPRTVTLSLSEYNRLIDLARRPPGRPPVLPAPAVLAAADLRVRVEREVARGVFSIAGEALQSGVSRIGLIAGATLVEANAGGRPLPLLADGNAHVALVEGPGAFSATLEWGAPIKFAPGRASFALPVPSAGAVRATVDLPGDQVDVHLSSGLITRRTVDAGHTIVEATLVPGSTTEVWWSMRDSAPVSAAREVRALADVFTLVTLGDGDVRMVGLVDITVVQGEPRTFQVRLPPGYEITSITGGTLDVSAPRDGNVVSLTVSDPTARRHQALISLERPHGGDSFTFETGFISIPDTQRERGEIAVEGVGTLELDAAETDGMHRIDVRELNPALQSLSRMPILSAFRYQRNLTAPAALTFNVKRFADAGVLAAIADRGVATTLVTTEGRALTEISLVVRNRAQPFMKVTLPSGAAIVSVEVAGESAKPVLGPDGTRVPLLRQGFRPQGPYTVSFVYVHAGQPFAKRGTLQMALAKLDLPVGIIDWEVFAPAQYSMRAIDGNVVDRRTLKVEPGEVDASAAAGAGGGIAAGAGSGVAGGLEAVTPGLSTALAGPQRGAAGGIHMPASGQRGQILGRVVDAAGGALPGVTVDAEINGSHRTAVTGPGGQFLLSGMPTGVATVTARLAGFAPQAVSFAYDQQPQRVEFALSVNSSTQTVTATGQTQVAGMSDRSRPAPPSQNVVNLQRRAAGVLPIRVEVPRAGTSHQFVKPLVVGQPPTVSFQYRRR